jgi:hypothetical protein
MRDRALAGSAAIAHTVRMRLLETPVITTQFERRPRTPELS